MRSLSWSFRTLSAWTSSVLLLASLCVTLDPLTVPSRSFILLDRLVSFLLQCALSLCTSCSLAPLPPDEDEDVMAFLSRIIS